MDEEWTNNIQVGETIGSDWEVATGFGWGRTSRAGDVVTAGDLGLYRRPTKARSKAEWPSHHTAALVKTYVGDLVAAVHANAVEHGWWDEPRNDGEAIALMHSELSEALEALRAPDSESAKIPGFSALEEELADVVIRICDYAGGRKLRLGEAIVAKHEYNRGRPHKHGRKF